MATIVSFADLKAMIQLSKDSFDDYPNLELIADQVHDALEDYVGRTLDLVAKQTETGIFIGEDKFINLKSIPIKSITSVVVDGNTLTDDYYTINNYGITLTSLYSGAWTVVLKGGFNKVIPPKIYRAEMAQIVYEYQNINNLAAKSFTNDGGTVSLPGFVLLDQVKDLLNDYFHINKMGY